MHSYYHLGSLVRSYFFVGYLSSFCSSILVRLVEDRVIEVRVSFYKL
jgi:hypothetical protein